jgi:flagellar basal body-associated protein FliL
MSTVTRDMLQKQAQAQTPPQAAPTPAKKGGSKLVVGIAVFVLLALAATVALLFVMKAKGGLTPSPPVTRTLTPVTSPAQSVEPCCKSEPTALTARLSG